MTTDPNTERDWAMLTLAMRELEARAEQLENAHINNLIIGEDCPLAKALAFKHAINFIEFNMAEMNIVSPIEHYLQMK